MAWQWSDVWPHPEEEYFQEAVIGYYEDGRQYDYHYGNKWAGDMQDLINKADKCGWKKSFDEKTKIFTFEKHFSSGMYRIATYTPRIPEKLDLTVHYEI